MQPCMRTHATNGLACKAAAESSVVLQHTASSLAVQQAPGRVPRLLLLVISLALTGHGEAFVRLKARLHPID